jgi:hypothetical protein
MGTIDPATKYMNGVTEHTQPWDDENNFLPGAVSLPAFS